MRMLLANAAFMVEARGSSKGKGKLGPPAIRGWVEKWRQELKIAGVRISKRQRLMLLTNLNCSDNFTD